MNFLADGQTTKKWKIIPITKSLFFGESCSSSVVVACGRGPILFEKKLMEFHFGWWTFYRDSHSGGVVALGVEVGVGVGWVEGWFWEVDVQEAATILAQDLGSCRERGWGRRRFWLWLKDRVEQSGFFFNSASRPLAYCNHQSWGAIGEEGLGFWALKSEKERGWITRQGLTIIGGLVPEKGGG